MAAILETVPLAVIMCASLTAADGMTSSRYAVINPQMRSSTSE